MDEITNVANVANIWRIMPQIGQNSLTCINLFLRYMAVVGKTNVKLWISRRGHRNPTCLPGEIWAEIFSWCDPRTLRCAMVVCKYFRKVIPRAIAGELALAERQFGIFDDEKCKYSGNISWLDHCDLISCGGCNLQLSQGYNPFQLAGQNGAQLLVNIIKTNHYFHRDGAYDEDNYEWFLISDMFMVCDSKLQITVGDKFVRLCECCNRIGEVYMNGIICNILWQSCLAAKIAKGHKSFLINIGIIDYSKIVLSITSYDYRITSKHDGGPDCESLCKLLRILAQCEPRKDVKDCLELALKLIA